MYYPDRKIISHLLFLFDKYDKYMETKEFSLKRDDPRSIQVRFYVMTLKNITEFRAQHRWLLHHPFTIAEIGMPGCPSHVTLTWGYKTLYTSE